ncbi:MAG: DUF6210 family protein [Verrucomicrobiota bacterium]
MKPLLQLYDSIGTGIILAFPSGVIYSNQTGGTACLSPEMEGVFVPLRNDYQLSEGPMMSPEIELTQYFEGPRHRGRGATSGIDLEDADFIDSILDRVELRPVISVDRTRLAESHEAWIHVVVSGDEYPDTGLAVFAGFTPYPRQGILTWCNSD